MPSPQERFAHRLRTAMQEKYGPRAKAAQLARATGLSEQTISRWLNAKVVPTPALLRQLTPALDVPLAEWLAIAGITDDHDSPERRAEWGEWVDGALAHAGLTPQEFAEDAGVELHIVESWLARRAVASMRHATDAARAVQLPASGALRAAGYPKEASELEQLAATKKQAGPLTPNREEAITSLVAGVTEGLTPQDAERIGSQLQEDVELLIQLARAKADKLRETTEDGRSA